MQTFVVVVSFNWTKWKCLWFILLQKETFAKEDSEKNVMLVVTMMTELGIILFLIRKATLPTILPSQNLRFIFSPIPDLACVHYCPRVVLWLGGLHALWYFLTVTVTCSVAWTKNLNHPKQKREYLSVEGKKGSLGTKKRGESGETNCLTLRMVRWRFFGRGGFPRVL